MELEFTEKGIVFNKELNPLDEFVLYFTRLLDEQGIGYCIVSGYVAILFGRSRTSEDIDLFIERIDPKRFKELWNRLIRDFECLITSDPNDAYDTYLDNSQTIRFSRKGQFIPNIEIKFPKTSLDRWTLENRLRVIVNNRSLHVSPMEVQIPYKLKLGSEKDIEDAIYLYSIFKDKLNLEALSVFLESLGQKETFRRYLD
ncbi:MAG: hypothetical protein KAU14_10460 [Thermoplasmata archaeon]|nr:hypothetical protein [Thermoplasmata archaeon]